MKNSAIQLIAWHANGSKQTYSLSAEQGVFVGRSTNCGFQLNGADISDIHCRIELESGNLWVQDWMSARGTKVNDQEVSCKTKIGLGSLIEVGPYKIKIAGSGETTGQPDSNSGATTNSETPVGDGESHADDGVQSLATDSTDQGVDRAASCDSSQVHADIEQTPDSESESVRSDAENHLSQEAEELEVHSESACLFDESDIFGESELEDDYIDRETVELLQAEIEDLRAALSRKDADTQHQTEQSNRIDVTPHVDTVRLQKRLDDLIEEANRADERVMILEEMLLAAEDASRFEQEERNHLEAWVKDIESRIGAREQEQAAELEVLRSRLAEADQKSISLQRKLKHDAADDSTALQDLQASLESLQQDYRELQTELDEEKKQALRLQGKVENQAKQTEVELREERAKIAREQAEVSRLKYQLADKLKELESEEPKSDVDPRIQSLSDHRKYLREMSQQRKQQSTLSDRLKNLWSRVE